MSDATNWPGAGPGPGGQEPPRRSDDAGESDAEERAGEGTEQSFFAAPPPAGPPAAAPGGPPAGPGDIPPSPQARRGPRPSGGDQLFGPPQDFGPPPQEHDAPREPGPSPEPGPPPARPEPSAGQRPGPANFGQGFTGPAPAGPPPTDGQPGQFPQGAPAGGFPPPQGSPPQGPPSQGAPRQGPPPQGQPPQPGPSQPGQPPHGQPSHGQPSHGQPSHGQPSHGQPSHGQPPQGMPPQGPPPPGSTQQRPPGPYGPPPGGQAPGGQAPPGHPAPPPPPGQGYGPPPGQDFGPPPGQDFGPPPGQDFGSPPGQGYGPPPGQSFGPPPGQDFGPPPGQDFGPPPGQGFGGPERGTPPPPPPPPSEPADREWTPGYLPWDTPAGEEGQDSSGSSWQPPGSGQSEIGQPAFSDDDLDLDERRKRKLPMLIGGVVVVLALVVGGYFAWPYIKPASSDPEPGGNGPGKPAAASVASVEDALSAKGYECYDALGKPVKVRSCYPTKDAPVPMTVRMQADGKSVAAAQIYAPLQGAERGPALKAFDELSKDLAGDILGEKDADLMPTASDGDTRKAEGAKWGSAAVEVTAGLAVTEFIKSGAEVAEPEPAKLPLSVEQMRSKLTKTGFTCQPTLCEKTLGEKGEKHSVGASFGPTTMRVAFRPRADKKPHEVDAVKQSISDVIGTILSAPEREKVLAWIDSNRAKQPREADFAGVHVNLEWGDGTEPALTMSTPIAWG